MQPYEKENKFMTFMNFAQWTAGVVTGYNTTQDSFVHDNG